MQGIRAALRCYKHQHCREHCQRQQHSLPEFVGSIHKHALRIHIYVAARRGQNCGMGGSGMWAKHKTQPPHRWLAALFRQPPKGFYRTYSPASHCLQMPHGRFTVHGDELKIITLTATRLTLRGRFLRTDFADE